MAQPGAGTLILGVRLAQAHTPPGRFLPSTRTRAKIPGPLADLPGYLTLRPEFGMIGPVR
jgi:hypothetical protein